MVKKTDSRRKRINSDESLFSDLYLLAHRVKKEWFEERQKNTPKSEIMNDRGEIEQVELVEGMPGDHPLLQMSYLLARRLAPKSRFTKETMEKIRKAAKIYCDLIEQGVTGVWGKMNEEFEDSFAREIRTGGAYKKLFDEECNVQNIYNAWRRARQI